MQATKGADRAETLFIEPDAVSFQNRSGTLLQVGQLGVVLQQGLGLGTDRVAPIGNGLQDDQKVLATASVLVQLQVQVRFRCITYFRISAVLLVELRQISDSQSQLMGCGMQALIQIGSIARGDEFLS